MIHIIKSADRHFSDMGWLKTYWLFSFSNYYDPQNVSHGMLRVFNDDVVEANQGFDTHPHEEMEIISIVLDGQMEHRDTMENKTVIHKNDVQRMTAGTGLYHSEKNESDKSVHFYQIWIHPDRKGLAPSYDQKSFNPKLWKNKLALLASDKPEQGVVSLNTKACVYRSALETGGTVSYRPEAKSCPFLYVMTGTIAVNGVFAEKNDQIRVNEERTLTIDAIKDAEFLLIDVPS